MTLKEKHKEPNKEDLQLVLKWSRTGLLRNLMGSSKRAIDTVRELEEHAQYVLTHADEYKNWIYPGGGLAKSDWAGWYFDGKIVEMRERGCFKFEGVEVEEIKEKHKELNEKVDELSELNHLTPTEREKLKNLKKLKLKYKDTINKLTYDD